MVVIPAEALEMLGILAGALEIVGILAVAVEMLGILPEIIDMHRFWIHCLIVFRSFFGNGVREQGPRPAPRRGLIVACPGRSPIACRGEMGSVVVIYTENVEFVRAGLTINIRIGHQ